MTKLRPPGGKKEPPIPPQPNNDSPKHPKIRAPSNPISPYVLPANKTGEFK